MEKVKVGVVGATGYAGAELVRLLIDHPDTELAIASSVSFGGKNISTVYPGLRAGGDIKLADSWEGMPDLCDVIFASLPHGHSEKIGSACRETGKLFIDLGADFRLEDEAVYEEWYGSPFQNRQLHSEAVYGLCELYRDEIRGALTIANPGCYPTSAALGLWPALSHGLVSAEGIIIDAKSGVTGAGRGLSQNTHFPEHNEGFCAYKAGGHRHRPEIEQTLSKITGKEVKVTFTPHLLPVNRGILSTIYCRAKTDLPEALRAYRDAYGNETFVTVLEEGEHANIRNVKQSNSCHISLHMDEHTGTLIVCSAIDNMVKGAAGQAIQNMNIALGLSEGAGLKAVAPAF